MSKTKHEMFREAFDFGVGELQDENRRSFLKRCAVELGMSFGSMRDEYEAWEETFGGGGRVPSLAECARQRDFMPARIALALGGAYFSLYTEQEINGAQANAGIALDAEDSRRAKAIAEQSARWEQIGSSQLGGYEIRTEYDGSVTTAKFVKGGTASPELLCKYFFVRGKAQNYEGEGWHYVLEFRDDAGKWKIKLVAANTVGGRSDDWVRPLRDAGAVIVDAPLLSNLMQTTRDLKIIRIAVAPGWQNQDHTVYTTLDGTTIGAADDTEAVFVKPKSYGRKGTKEEADKQIFNRAVGNSRLIGTTTGMLAGPFLAPLHVHPGLVHLYGASGDGKTVSQRCGQAVMGSGARILSWNTTENGFEGLATQHNGGSMAIEELKQGAAPKTVYKGIMALGNGTGKQAMNRDRKLKETAEFQVFGVSSGEADVRSFLTAGKTPGVTYDGGVASRCADVPSDAGCKMGCFENLHGFSSPYEFAKALEKASTEHYGHHLPALLEAYLANPESGLDRIKALKGEALAAIGIDGDENVSRVIERFALMAAAGEFATEKGVLNWPTGEALRGVLRLVADWRLARHGDADTVAGSTEALMGVQMLDQSLASHGARFQGLTGASITNRLGFLLENDEHEMVLYLSKAQLAEIVGSERVQPVLQYISDDKSSRFALRKGAKGFQISTPRKAGAYVALGKFCYGIVIREVDADELGAAALRS